MMRPPGSHLLQDTTRQPASSSGKVNGHGAFPSGDASVPTSNTSGTSRWITRSRSAVRRPQH